MMIPITRKEKYINEIVGGGNTAPETPYTRKELFYADILGEVVAPSPITRAEKYLAKIANKYSGELPEPVTRIERFLARAAGMDVTIPTPITREEMFWADYALIGEKELSGIPPLTFVSNGENLADYRIYGASGGVGDRTRNLIDEKAIGIIVPNPQNPNTVRTGLILNNLSNDTYFFSFSPASSQSIITYARFYNGTRIDTSALQVRKTAIIDMSSADELRWWIPSGEPIANFKNIQLTAGNIGYDYEPYGYKIPVVCGGITTNIYLDEPLAKSGNNADYIDYAAQKRHNSDGTESSVTLPEISTLAGTNTLTVGTEVQPSNVYIKYEGVR